MRDDLQLVLEPEMERERKEMERERRGGGGVEGEEREVGDRMKINRFTVSSSVERRMVKRCVRDLDP